MAVDPKSDHIVVAPSLVAAQLVVGQLHIERMPRWAADMLALGHDGEARRELACLDAADTRAIRDLLPTALAELGIDVPSDVVAAAVVVFSDLAARTLAGKLGERWTAEVVEDVVIRADYAGEVIDPPLGQLYAVSDMWAGKWGPPEPELRQVVSNACSEQLAHGQAAEARSF